jgi:hypothetical protein
VSRLRTVFTTVVPSMIAGGLLFASAFGHADAGREAALGVWPAAAERALVAQADPRPRPRPDPWAAPAPPAPPAPPVPASRAGAWSPSVPVPSPAGPVGSHRRQRRGHGVSVSIRDGKIELEGVAELVQAQLEAVSGILDGLPDVPPDVRDRIKVRVQAVRARVAARLARLASTDTDKLGAELERMGDDIEKEMTGLDKDLEQLGDKLGKHLAGRVGKELARSLSGHNLSVHTDDSHHHDDDDDGDGDDDDDSDEDDRDAVLDLGRADLGDRVAGLRNLRIDQAQRAELTKLRAASDAQITTAKRELDALSEQLHDALGDARLNEAEIARQIDAISAKEATIRKARILTWVRARGLLHPDQRKQVEAAASKGR